MKYYKVYIKIGKHSKVKMVVKKGEKNDRQIGVEIWDSIMDILFLIGKKL